MKTNATLALGLLAALVVLAPTALADAPAEPDAEAQCPPVWFDTQGNPHVDPSCLGSGPVFDNRP